MSSRDDGVSALDFLNLPGVPAQWWKLRPTDLLNVIRGRELLTGVVGSFVALFFVTLNAIVGGIFGAIEFAINNVAGFIVRVTDAVAAAAIQPMLSAVGIAEASILGQGLAGVLVGTAIALGTFLVINIVLNLFGVAGD